MKVDFRFTDEGDLELGSPEYDKFDQLLYVDSVGDTSTEPGDGELIRDIPLQVSYMSDKQVILNRLKTDNPDWLIHPEIGADLVELVGEPNTRETALKGVELIRNSLCNDGFLDWDDVEVKPVPISPSEILFYLKITFRSEVMVLPILYDIEHGLMTQYEVEKPSEEIEDDNIEDVEEPVDEEGVV